MEVPGPSPAENSKRVGTGKDYKIAETIIVPQADHTLRRHKSPHHHSAKAEAPAALAANDPKEIVKKFWHGSFSDSRNRKLTQTKSKIRQQVLLSEELQRLEKETLLWREVFSDLSGSFCLYTYAATCLD